MATDYGKRLREARKDAKLTQEKLSEITGIPQSTISTAERMGYGSAETPVYAKACKVDAHWLATGEGSKTPAGPDLVVRTSPDTVVLIEAKHHHGGVSGTIKLIAKVAEGLDEATRDAVGRFLKRAMTHPEEAPILATRVSALLGELDSTPDASNGTTDRP